MSGAAFPVDGDGRPAEGWWALAVGPLEWPMFTVRSGEIYRTADARALFKRIAALAGLDPADVGAKGGRIGGATDARYMLGEAGKARVKRRGRWASDVAEVYQRELVGEQLALSAGMGGASGASLEEVCEGWADPA